MKAIQKCLTLIAAGLALLSPLATQADLKTYNDGTLTWVWDWDPSTGTTASLQGYRDGGQNTIVRGVSPAPTGKVVVPSTVKYTYTITMIQYNDLGEPEWSEVQMTKDVEVTELKYYLFKDCTEITEVVLPDTVQSLRDGVFCGCSELTTLNVPSGLKYVDGGILAGTAWLDAQTDDFVMFGDGFLLRYQGSNAQVAIPESVKVICSDAFCENDKLEAVTIPDSVKEIGNYAFLGCTNLTVVKGAENVVKVGYNTFDDTAIWEAADDDAPVCVAQDTIVVGYKGDLEDEIEIEDGVKVICNECFWECDSITAVSLPDSLRAIGEYAFYGCTALESITIPESVTFIGDGAFCGCTALESITIPEGVTFIGDEAFWSCTALEEITIPDSVTDLGENVFEDCSALRSLVIGSGVTDLLWLGWMENLESVEIYASVIPDSLFSGFENLTDVTLGDSVEEIGEEAFSGCTALESIFIPESVTFIGEGAFYSCVALEQVEFEGEMDEIEMDVESAFGETPWLERLLTPENDNFADAAEITGVSGEISGKNTCASLEEGEYAEYYEGCNPVATVWYKWTAPASGVVSFGVMNAEFDTIIGVYRGSSIDGLKRPAFSDDTDVDGYSSFTVFDAVAGVTYYISVGGYEDEMGTFDLVWAPYEFQVEFEIKDGVLYGVSAGVFPPILTIPDGVTNIAESAFEDCDLQTVQLPSSLKSISEYAFAYSGLEVLEGLTDGVQIGPHAFFATPYDEICPFQLVVEDGCVLGFVGQCPSEVNIPENVTNIAESAFDYWGYSREGSVFDEDLGEYVYCDVSTLTNLTKVTISENIATIGEWVFCDCSNLSSVVVANAQIKIDGSAFSGCTALKEIEVSKVGHSHVGWDLARYRNPYHWVEKWDDDGNWLGYEKEEYEPDFLPIGESIHIDDIKPLVYGMATGGLVTNMEYCAELDDWVEVFRPETNWLAGIWATPTWKVNQYRIMFDSDGGSDVATITQGYGTAIKAPAAPRRKGYTFVGWEPALPVTMPAEDMTLTAQWTANRYTVSFDANGGTGEMDDQEFVYDEVAPLSECTFTRAAYDFLGWALSADSDELVLTDGELAMNLTEAADGKVTLYAVWDRASLWDPVRRNPDGTIQETGSGEGGDNAFLGDNAEVYDGYIYNEKDMLVGTLQMKVAKAKLSRTLKVKTAKVSVSIQLANEGKQTLKGTIDITKGVFEAKDKSGRPLRITIGSNGLSGTYGAYYIDGAQNKFFSKSKLAKSIGAEVLTLRKKAYAVAWLSEDGWNTLSVSVEAKGKVKITGTMANGVKVSAKSQMIIGAGGTCVIPVVVTKKVSLAFNLWLTNDGVEITGIDGAKAGVVKNVGANAKFVVEKTAKLWTMAADSPFTAQLPDGVKVNLGGGTKWEQPTAGKVAYVKGTTELDEAKALDNPSGLKLTYKAKDGTFKGSFKLYAADKGTKLKAISVNVTGVLVDGVGYGTATIKKIGSVPVTIE